MKYKRVLLKLSGESLAGTSNQGINYVRLNEYADQIKETRDMGAQVVISFVEWMAWPKVLIV